MLLYNIKRMSSQIEPILVKDDILMCSDKIGFAVSKGGQNVSVQRFPATSTSSTSHVYTINVPSTNVVMSREVLWTSTVTLTITGTPAAGEYLLPYSETSSCDVIAPFPLHQLTTNMSAQINNTTVSNTTNQILDPILRQLEKGKLSRYNTSAPVYLDNYSDYSESFNVINSPFSDATRAVDYNYPPRGAFSVSVSGNTVQAEGATDVKTVLVTFTSTEALMLSPFVYGDAEKKAPGMYGISQINVTMTMDALAKRAWRWIDDEIVMAANKTISNVAYSNSYLECRFLSPHPSDMLPQENLVPYQQFTNYLKTENAPLVAGASFQTTSNNIQLSAIPDKLICFIRDQQSNLNNTSADCYATITGISILFNNQSGMLSSCDITDLYRMSLEAGSQQSFLEFKGKARFANDADVASYGSVVGTTGSVLVLNFAEHIALNEEFYAPSSIGSFNFQIQVSYTNNTKHTITPELNTLFVHSGIFSCNNGVSASYIGVLNKQQVLDASLQVPVGKADLARMVGGGWFDSIKAIASKALPMIKKALPMVKNVLGQIDHPLAKKGQEALGSLGFGATGGMETGGRRRIKHL